MAANEPDRLPTADNPKQSGPRAEAPAPEALACDICGSTDVGWLRCKLVCNRCHTILMTCGDL